MPPKIHSPRDAEYYALRSQAASIWSRIDEITALILCDDYAASEWLTVASLEGQAKQLEYLAEQIYNSPEFWAGYERAGNGLKVHDDLGELYND